VVKAQIEHQTWGQWPSIKLSTEAVELVVVSEVGARVVSLRDKRRDREWLVQGEPPTELEQMAWAEEGVAFGGRESFGWDECLPTTSICGDPLVPTGPDLRDHGDQWGRGAYLALDMEQGAVEHTWSTPRWGYRMVRRLSFDDEQTVRAPVLKIEPGGYIDLPDVYQARRSTQLGIDLPETLDWPKAVTSDGREMNLACVRTDEGWAAVLYMDPPEDVRLVAPDGARLDFEWDRDFAPVLRVWQAYGGWQPEGTPVEQVALEPCTSMHDDLAGAIADGAAGSRAWLAKQQFV